MHRYERLLKGYQFPIYPSGSGFLFQRILILLPEFQYPGYSQLVLQRFFRRILISGAVQRLLLPKGFPGHGK